jgi:hypothetical protein
MMRLAHPYAFDNRGRTREADLPGYVRGLVEQLIFTAPGERVMRPDFGSGVYRMVFAGNGPELAGAAQFLIQSALTRWLAGLIEVESVTAEARDGTLSVEVRYRLLASGEARVDRFSVPGG